MHVEYRIGLPDHDWVKAEKHKLIPSVYAGLIIKEGGWGNPEAVTYSGPTLIRIRSGKHDKSCASSHASDLHFLLNHSDFKSLCRTKNDEVKPVLIISTDGGPDENPRYEKVIQFAILHFEKYDLDAIFIVTNAPGRSAYNPVERRLAPLSHATSGVILEAERYGSHLNEQGKTIDVDLELDNFKFAGEKLSEIWSEMTIDRQPVFSMYVEPEQSIDLVVPQKSQDWFQKHLRTSQYLTQVVKCKQEDCCGPLRSNIRNVLPSGFLPPPMRVKFSSEGKIVAADVNNRNCKFLPLFQQLACDIKPPSSGYMEVNIYHF